MIILFKLYNLLPLFKFLLNQILVAAIFNLPSSQERDTRFDVDLTLPIIAFCSAEVFNHARRS